jgi:hypothetical protein
MSRLRQRSGVCRPVLARVSRLQLDARPMSHARPKGEHTEAPSACRRPGAAFDENAQTAMKHVCDKSIRVGRCYYKLAHICRLAIEKLIGQLKSLPGVAVGGSAADMDWAVLMTEVHGGTAMGRKSGGGS